MNEKKSEGAELVQRLKGAKGLLKKRAEAMSPENRSAPAEGARRAATQALMELIEEQIPRETTSETTSEERFL